ncbi:MAG: CsbD family protein [Acidimicrobiia bacterium]|nr:CsbD family protein [Acidimicrobiia bacterium]
MAGEMDETKGRIKEAAGDLTDDDELKREGKIDKGTGKAKNVVDKISDKIKGN